MKLMLLLIATLCITNVNAQENWIYRYDGAGYDDEANTIVYGLDGNIYTAGYSIGSGTCRDIIVISLTQTGDTNWTYQYNGQGNGDDEATSLVYGLDDNVYVAGYTTGSGTGFDMILISLTTGGDTNWTYRYNAMDNNDVVNSIAYGDDNNLYIAGYSEQENPYYYDMLAISLTNNGIVRWAYRNDPREKIFLVKLFVVLTIKSMLVERVMHMQRHLNLLLLVLIPLEQKTGSILEEEQQYILVMAIVLIVAWTEIYMQGEHIIFTVFIQRILLL